jgi:hypothetical protein
LNRILSRLPVGAPRAPPKAGVESLPGAAEEAAPGRLASQVQSFSPSRIFYFISKVFETILL